LTKYYVAFDFENARVGLALASENSQDRCASDQPMDINNHQEFTPVATEMVATKSPTPQTVPIVESPTISPGPEAKNSGENFEFADLESSNRAGIFKAVNGNQDSDRIAMFVGFGIGMFAIALLMWRVRKVRRQRAVDAIVRHAEANSPYSDTSSYKDESFVEIDLRTLHRMN
jgi:hypothetical protein